MARLRLLKVYRREIIFSALVSSIGTAVFLVLGWNGFLWMVEKRKSAGTYPFFSGALELNAAVCLFVFLEAVILNLTVSFMSRIRYIYKKTERASRERKMFRHNIIREYTDEKREG